VQTKPDPKRPGEKLSMGYGFVGFTTQDAAKKGLRALEGFEVDGKVLEPRFAQRGAEDVERENGKTDGKGSKEGDKKSTKLLVKNLPFEATKKDVRELFRSVFFSFIAPCISESLVCREPL
jgi:multiple RNA-binding domain-containing protein 1